MMCRGGSQTNAGVMEEMSPTLTAFMQGQDNVPFVWPKGT